MKKKLYAAYTREHCQYSNGPSLIPAVRQPESARNKTTRSFRMPVSPRIDRKYSVPISPRMRPRIAHHSMTRKLNASISWNKIQNKPKLPQIGLTLNHGVNSMQVTPSKSIQCENTLFEGKTPIKASLEESCDSAQCLSAESIKLRGSKTNFRNLPHAPLPSASPQAPRRYVYSKSSSHSKADTHLQRSLSHSNCTSNSIVKRKMIIHSPCPFRDFVFSYLKRWTGCRQLSETFNEGRSRGLEWRLASLILIDRYIVSSNDEPTGIYACNKTKIRWEEESLLKRSVHPSVEENIKRWIGVFGDRFLVEMTNLWHYAISLSQRGYHIGAIDKYNKCIRMTMKQWKSTLSRLEIQKYNERLAYLYQGKCVCYWSILQKQRMKRKNLDFNEKVFEEYKNCFEDAITHMTKYFTLLYKDPFLQNVREMYRIILIGAYVRRAQFYIDFVEDEEKSLDAWQTSLSFSMESSLDLVLYQVYIRMQIAQTFTYNPESIHLAIDIFHEILSDYRQDLDLQWVNHLLMCICITEAMARLTDDLQVFRSSERWNYMCIDLFQYCQRLCEGVNKRFKTTWQKDLIDSIIESMREVSLGNFDHTRNMHFSNSENQIGSDLKWIQKSLNYIRNRLLVAVKCNMIFISDEELGQNDVKRDIRN